MTPVSSGLHRAWRRCIAALITWSLILVCATWRKRDHGLVAFDRRLEVGEQLIVMFWHGSFPALLPLFRHRRALVFTSRSRRGDVIRLVLERLGFVACQLADHGGAESLTTMRDALSRGLSVAIAVDGPLGPYHVVHRGVIELAATAGVALVPASLAVSKSLVLKRRWDSLTLPLPFARTRLVLGVPLRVPRMEQLGNLATWQKRAARALRETDEWASHLLAGTHEWP